jgi:hypothetical protein
MSFRASPRRLKPRLGAEKGGQRDAEHEERAGKHCVGAA